jgi:hypothetical protein
VKSILNTRFNAKRIFPSRRFNAKRALMQLALYRQLEYAKKPGQGRQYK